MQNRRQKIFNRGLCVFAGGLGFVQGVDTLKTDKTQLIYSILFLFGGAWSFVWGAKPPKASPWRRDCSNVLGNTYLK